MFDFSLHEGGECDMIEKAISLFRTYSKFVNCFLGIKFKMFLKNETSYRRSTS